MFYYGKNHENECWSLDFSCDFFSDFLCSTTEKQWYFLYVSLFIVCVYGSGLSFYGKNYENECRCMVYKRIKKENKRYGNAV